MIGFKPGVTDNRAQAALDGLQTIFPNHQQMAVSTTIGYHFWDVPSDVDLQWLMGQLHNPLIELAKSTDRRTNSNEPWPSLDFPDRPILEQTLPSIVDLEVSDKELIKISEDGLLALNLNEMKAIQNHYRNSEIQSIRKSRGLSPNAPTDVALALLFGQDCFGETISNLEKPKFFKDRAQEPIFSPSCGLTNIKPNLFFI